MQLGAALGALSSLALFLTVPAYHDLVVWQWTHWYLWLSFGVVGGVLAALTD